MSEAIAATATTKAVEVDCLGWKTVKVRDCAKGKCPVIISYEAFGNPTDPCVLLVMGINGQGSRWGEDLCQQIMAAGYYVIRFDNRDIGFSTKFDHMKCAPMWHLLFPNSIMGWKAPYSLVDMAEDACGLLTALGIKKAHWVGVSMGGMIAQTAAIHFPDRVASMVSMMSTTGNQSLPDPSFGTKMWFLKKPKSSALEDVIAHEVQYFKAILCTGVTFTPEVDKHILENVTSLVTRSTYKLGGDRQMFAVRCAPNRDDDLAKIKTPSLVLHGKDDLLVFPKHGEHTAKAIAAGNSTRTPEEAAMHKGLKILSGMGHYIGPWNYEAVCAELFPFWKEADNASSGAQK